MNERFIYPTAAWYLTDCMLNVTDDCNLQCRYCFVQQQPHYMTLQTAKDIADWLYQNLQKKKRMGLTKKDEKIRFYFFGGEPMLCYKSIIVPVIDYIENKYPNSFYYGMTTNGTLLNKEVIDFIKKHNFQLLLSIDGNKETQDYNRPCKNCNQSSFDLIEKNIPYLLENFPNLTFRSTIYAPTVEHLFENYLYAESLGFKCWEAIEDNRHPWTSEQIETLKNEFSKIYSYRLQQIIEKKSVMKCGRINEWLFNITKLYEDNDYYNINKHCSVWRCGLGTATGSISWDGSIYGCQEQVSQGHSTIFYIGSIYKNGIDIKKHYNLLSFYYKNQLEGKVKKEECNNCELCPICKVNILGCPSTTKDLFNDMNSITEIGCQLRKIYYNNSLLTLKLLFSLNDKEIIDNLLKIIQNREGCSF